VLVPISVTAQEGSGTLTIDPTSGVQGPDIPVAVSLTGCETEVSTTILGTLTDPNGEVIGNYTAENGVGGWGAGVTVPGDGALGTYHVTGTCYFVREVPSGGSSPAGADLEPWFDYAPAPFVLTAPDDPDEPEEPEEPEKPEEPEEEPEVKVEAERETAPPATPVEAQPSFTG
jgi:hypothetical protein